MMDGRAPSAYLLLTATVPPRESLMTVSGWADVATFSSGFEADIAIATLEAGGIRAERDSNDTVGIFGPGFQGATARGVTVRVPADQLDEARAALQSTDGSA